MMVGRILPHAKVTLTDFLDLTWGSDPNCPNKKLMPYPGKVDNVREKCNGECSVKD